MGPLGGSGPRTPWLVPEEQKMELIFFRKVYLKLMSESGTESNGIALVRLQRSMCRLCKILRDERNFDAKEYDINGDGMVGWWEFSILWKQEAFDIKLSLAERIFLTLEDPHRSILGKLTTALVLGAILLSACCFIFSTLPSMQVQPCSGCPPEELKIFDLLDTICLLLFSLEYLLRVYTAAFMRTELMNEEEMIESMTTDNMTDRPTKCTRVLTFVMAWPNLIDIAAILPSYFPMLTHALGAGAEFADVGIIRLMRIVRAFRLGRRFEAVIIIGRAMGRSVRALWVLILNVSMGMLVFGATLFFLEQGEYDADTKSWIRFEGYELNAAGDGYVEYWGRSPFRDIPHAFWWALVTSTTVGYGDVSPTTGAGKVLAGLAMVYSLCVIALPVGVIGHNFQSVWHEYDLEKQTERKLKDIAKQMTRSTLCNIEPLIFSRIIGLEVYHSAGVGYEMEHDVFIGEAETELDLEAIATTPASGHLCLPLCENRQKANRKVHGEVNLLWKWTPSEHAGPGTILQGELVITVLSGKNLVCVDWKGTGISDPYVVLTSYPQSPNSLGVIKPQVQRTSTVFDQIEPMWNDVMKFDFYWHKDGVKAKRELEKRNISLATDQLCDAISASQTLFSPELLHPDSSSSPTRKTSPKEMFPGPAPMDFVQLPQMQQEVASLKSLVPALSDEVRTIREGMSTIMFELGILEIRSARPIDVPGPVAMHTPPPHPMHFAMPGMVVDGEDLIEANEADKDLRSEMTNA
mmetsp:Transcript_32378/g.58839  ORF Transcript_32378/g.58839 Transcript_32378/m.58839 type:complete len:749 (+) Transcript_32378:133-2379(+)